MLLAARRSAVDAATVAQRQLHALVTVAPEVLRAKFRGQSTRRMLPTTARVLRSLARRCLDLETEADDHEEAILAIVRSWRPDLLDQQGVGPKRTLLGAASASPR